MKNANGSRRALHGSSVITPVVVQIDSTLVGILTGTDLHVILQTMLQAVRWASPAELVETAPESPGN